LSDYVNQFSILSDFNEKAISSFVVLSSIEKRIKEKIENVGIPLKDWDIQINYGIKTGFNEAFIIDGKTKDELIAKSSKNAEIIRPILRGRDIKRYGYEFADLWLICTFPSLKIDIEEYPAVKEHLLSFGYDRLKQTGDLGARKKTNNQWFETQDSISYWDDFSKQKIVWKRVGSILRFGIDYDQCVTLDSTCFATGNHLTFLIGVLNSKLGNYMLQDSPKTGTGDLLISVQAIEPIRVPYPNLEYEKDISNIVEKLIEEENNIEYNKLLDSQVYSLYNLDNKEIDFIESQYNQ